MIELTVAAVVGTIIIVIGLVLLYGIFVNVSQIRQHLESVEPDEPDYRSQAAREREVRRLRDKQD